MKERPFSPSRAGAKAASRSRRVRKAFMLSVLAVISMNRNWSSSFRAFRMARVFRQSMQISLP